MQPVQSRIQSGSSERTTAPQKKERPLDAALQLASYGRKAYANLHDSNKQHPLVALAALKQDLSAIQDIPELTKESEEFKNGIVALGLRIEEDGTVTEEDSVKRKAWVPKPTQASETTAQENTIIPDELRSSYKYIRNAARHNVHILAQAAYTLIGNREFMWELVNHNGRALQYATDELKQNLALVQTAVANTPSALKYASDEIRNDFDVCLKAVSGDGKAYTYASLKLQTDPNFANKAVTANSRTLHFMDPAFIEKLDKEVLRRAIIDQPEYFSKLPEDLKHETKFIEALIRGNPGALEFLDSAAMQNLHPTVLLPAIIKHPKFFSKLPENLKHETEFIEALIQGNPTIYSQMGDLQKSLRPEFVLDLLADYPEAILTVPARFKADPQFIDAAIHKNRRAVIPHLLDDPTVPETIKDSIRDKISGPNSRSTPHSLEFIAPVPVSVVNRTMVDPTQTTYRYENEQRALDAIKKDFNAFLSIPENLKQNPRFIESAININPRVIPLVDNAFFLPGIKGDSSTILCFPGQKLYSRQFLEEACKENPAIIDLLLNHPINPEEFNHGEFTTITEFNQFVEKQRPREQRDRARQ